MGRIYDITTESEQSCAAATARTVLQLVSAATVRPRVLAWGVSFDGTSAAAEPVIVELVRQSTAGTSSAATVAQHDPGDPTALSTGRRGFSGTEPTTANRLEQYEVHPQGGMLIREYPPGREPMLAAATTSRLAIRVTAPATVNAVGFITFEE